MDIEIGAMASGYAERVRRIYLFDVLHTLEAKRNEKDQNGRELDYFSIGMMVLLFFFEKKLMRQTKVSAYDAAYFLERFYERTYHFSFEQYEKMAHAVIEVLRPSNGTRPGRAFYNNETGKHEKVEYTYLKGSGYDKLTNRQYYTLEENGLELVFSTREFFTEFQLSISQLMLRKQLEKGEFHAALRQITEMSIDVEALKNRMLALKNKLRSNILSDETFKHYQDVIEDIHRRMQYESEEFQELEQFVSETRERLASRKHDEKTEQAHRLIVQVARNLAATHEEHTQLFKEGIELKRIALEVAGESLYSAAVASFQFNRDVVTHIVTTPVQVPYVRHMLTPFLGIEQQKNWPLFALLAPQRIEKAEDAPKLDAFEEPDEDEGEQRAYMARQYEHMMRALLGELGSGETTVQKFVEAVRHSSQLEWLQQPAFYQFLLLLHQRSPLYSQKQDDTFYILDRALALLGEKRLRVEERSDMVYGTERFHMQNMTIVLEDYDDV